MYKNWGGGNSPPKCSETTLGRARLIPCSSPGVGKPGNEAKGEPEQGVH